MDLFPFWLGRQQRQPAAIIRTAWRLITTLSPPVFGSAGILAAAFWLQRATHPRSVEIRHLRNTGHCTERNHPEKLDRSILDVLPSHFCVLDETATIIAVNRAWRNFARDNPPILTEVCEGANYLNVCDAASNEPIASECGAALRALIAGHSNGFTIEYPCHSPTEERWFTVRAGRYFDGNSVRFVVVHEPITGQKLAERAVDQTEEHYRMIIEQAFDGIVVFDRQANFKLLNHAACRMTGYSREELLRISFRQLLPAEEHPPFSAAWEKRLAGELDPSEWSLIRKDGSRIVVELRTRVEGEGNLVGFLRDLSQRKEAEALREARDAAEAASSAKDHFLAMLSHELRTPLAPVLFATRLIEKENDLPERVRELAATIHRNVALQARLIDDLLDQSRIASGKLELQRQKVRVEEVIKRVLETLTSDFAAQQLEIQLELHASESQVDADVARLQQIFWNLLKNAVKFTPPGGVVTVRTSNPNPRRVRVEIEDNGIGIPPDLLAKLFHPFEQGGAITTRRFGGLGLGLAISDKLAKLHGGTLTAHSAGEGLGATFILEIPTAISAYAEAPLQPPQPDKPAVPPRLRILLVEDHLDTARILARILERRGHHVHVSHSLHDAEAAAEAEPLDLVLSDINLPDGTGYDLMQFLHDTHPLPGIAMSGFGMENDVRKSREAGFAEHLVKPVDPDRLEEVIDQVVASVG